MKRFIALAVVLFALASVALYTQISIFVIQPIGMLPEGRTLILWRQSPRLNFVDSADGVCLRIQDGVSIICRLGVMAGVAKNNPVIFRLPYSEALYLASTGGKKFVR